MMVVNSGDPMSVAVNRRYEEQLCSQRKRLRAVVEIATFGFLGHPGTVDASAHP